MTVSDHAVALFEPCKVRREEWCPCIVADHLLPCSKRIKVFPLAFCRQHQDRNIAGRSTAMLPHDGGNGARFGDAFPHATRANVGLLHTKRGCESPAYPRSQPHKNYWTSCELTTAAVPVTGQYTSVGMLIGYDIARGNFGDRSRATGCCFCQMSQAKMLTH